MNCMHGAPFGDCRMGCDDLRPEKKSIPPHEHVSDGMIYTSNPPKVKCAICGEFKTLPIQDTRYSWR